MKHAQLRRVENAVCTVCTGAVLGLFVLWGAVCADQIGDGSGEPILLDLGDTLGEDEPIVERHKPLRSLESVREHEREQRRQSVQGVGIRLEVKGKLTEVEAPLHGLVEEAEDASCRVAAHKEKGHIR